MFSNDRYTKIRLKKVESSECRADFSVETPFGVRLVTDSEKLAKEVELSIQNLNRRKVDIHVDFLYLTKESVPKVDELI